MEPSTGGATRNRATIIQQKAGHPVQFKLMTEARNSLIAWLQRRGGSLDDYIFPSRIDHLGHLSTPRYARLVNEWIAVIGLDVREYVSTRCAGQRRR